MDHLPPESATMTAYRNQAADAPPSDEPAPESQPERAPWSHLEMLVAQVVDELRRLRWVTVSAATGGKAGSPPDPMPRPGYKAGRRSRLSDAQRRILDPRLRVVEDEAS